MLIIKKLKRYIYPRRKRRCDRLTPLSPTITLHSWLLRGGGKGLILNATISNLSLKSQKLNEISTLQKKNVSQALKIFIGNKWLLTLKPKISYFFGWTKVKLKNSSTAPGGQH